jgi:hypothetical protein
MPLKVFYRRKYLFALAGVVAIILAGRTAYLRAAGADQRLSGSWKAVVTATNPPFLPPLAVLLTFTRDGEVVETRRLYNPASPFGPLLFTPGHGGWERTGDNAFAATIVDLFQAAPGNPAADGSILGEEEVRYALMLDPSGDALSGSVAGKVRDTAGNVLFAFTATVQGTRIR